MESPCKSIAPVQAHPNTSRIRAGFSALAAGICLAYMLSFCAMAQNQANIHGRVVDATTGEPLSGVHVRLEMRTAQGGVTAADGAISTAGGEFSVSALAPGAYLLRPELSGYVFMPSSKNGPASPIVNLQPPKNIDDLQIAMAREAVITGRVVDENGRPVPSVWLNVEPATPSDVALELALELSRDNRGSSYSDAAGQFRLSVPPGKYLLRAQGTSTEQIRADGTLAKAFYIATYYPNAEDSKSAAPVETKPGEETSGVEIHMVRKPALNLAGSVAGIPAGNVAFVHIRKESYRQATSVKVSDDGTFSAPGLDPGTYYIYADSGTGDSMLRSATAKVELRADVPDLLLALASPAVLSGSVATPPRGSKAPGLVVRLEQTTDFGNRQSFTATITPEGSFQFANLQPDRYNLAVVPMPEDTYIKTVRLDDAVIRDRGWYWSSNDTTTQFDNVPIDLSSFTAGSKLAIVLGNGARISGRVETKGGPATPILCKVMLVPEGKESVGEGRRTDVGSGGEYTLHGIPPGKYRLLAVNPLDLPDSPDVEHTILDRAETIEVHEGDRIVKDLQAIGKDSGDGKKN